MTAIPDNLETFSLLWLDASVNTSEENIKAQSELRAIINYLKTFDNVAKCEKYIRKCDESDRIMLIVSGGLGREIVPQIYKFRQIFSIYVYCMNKKKNKEWAKQYPKIKLVSTDLDKLIHQIRTDHSKKKKIEEQFSINFLQDNSITDRSSFGLNGQYVQFELLLDSLLRIEGTEKDKQELISICEKKYKDNKEEMKNVREFKRNYKPDQALWWYTKESFLYRMLNRALRRQDTSLLYLMRFFITDLWKAIEKHRCKQPIRTYRCQSISQEEFDGLLKATGKLISMTSFLSTSLDAEEARSFLDHADGLRKVFFEIDADPRLQGVKPFADVTKLSAHPDEREVLMTVGSIYRILDVNRQDDQFWVIRMQLCSENENSLRFTIEHMKLENLVVGHEQKRLAFVTQLIKMNKLDEAEKHLRYLQDTMPNNHKDIISLYSKLGDLVFEKDDLSKSLYWYQLALDQKQQIFKLNDPNLADSYNSIGNVYAKQKTHEEALKYYNKAMEIWKQTFGEEHLAIATCLSNIGTIYDSQKQYFKAHQYHNQALMIRRKLRPYDHPDVATSLHNLGLVFKSTGDLKKALQYFEQSILIKEKSLSFRHPSIALTWENMASVHEQNSELRKALMYYEKAAECYINMDKSTKDKLANIEQDIQRLKLKLKKK